MMEMLALEWLKYREKGRASLIDYEAFAECKI